jgi:hypothetical protein
VIRRIGSVCDWDGRSGFLFTRAEDRSTAGLDDKFGDPKKKIFVNSRGSSPTMKAEDSSASVI